MIHPIDDPTNTLASDEPYVCPDCFILGHCDCGGLDVATLDAATRADAWIDEPYDDADFPF